MLNFFMPTSGLCKYGDYFALSNKLQGILSILTLYYIAYVKVTGKNFSSVLVKNSPLFVFILLLC